jgi:Iap family predicted aminopeptidase
MIALLAAAALAAAEPAGSPAAPAGDGGSDAGVVLAAALRGGSHLVLAELTDLVGARLAGSPGADAAVRWAEAWFRRHAIPARLQPVRVNRWIRGEERAEVVPGGDARPQPLAVTALGNSGPTPPEGIVGEVIEARSLEELEALGPQVKGRIVLFQHDMRVASDYGRFAGLRLRGPAAAARLGAAAALVRSLSTATYRLPHTGTTLFPRGGKPIPAGAVAVEDAELVHRLLDRGPVRIRLVITGHPADPPLAPSANVIAEIRGAERPDEVVVIGAHLDAWDLGTGAIDDGAGVAMVLDTMRIAASMPRKPRRTLRAVLFMNEENGAEGAVAYHEAAQASGEVHVAAMEADSGGGRATGVAASDGAGTLERVGELAAPLAAVGAATVTHGGGGLDVSPLSWAGVPMVSVKQDTSRYFDWHHSAADTLDKVDPADLAQATAAFAWMAWALADAREPLPRQPVPPEAPWWKRPGH